MNTSQDNVLKNRAILAQNIKELRIKRKLRREELSLLLGFDNSYISKLERGSVNITIDKKYRRSRELLRRFFIWTFLYIRKDGKRRSLHPG